MYSAYNLPHFRLVALSFGERSYDPSPNDRVKYFPHKHFTHTSDQLMNLNLIKSIVPQHRPISLQKMLAG